jgi:hypothetical protein
VTTNRSCGASFSVMRQTCQKHVLSSFRVAYAKECPDLDEKNRENRWTEK